MYLANLVRRPADPVRADRGAGRPGRGGRRRPRRRWPPARPATPTAPSPGQPRRRSARTVQSGPATWPTWTPPSAAMQQRRHPPAGPPRSRQTTWPTSAAPCTPDSNGPASKTDLDEAVAAARQAVAASPPGHPDRALRLSTLGFALLAPVRADRGARPTWTPRSPPAGRRWRPSRPATPTAPRSCPTSAAPCRPDSGGPGTWPTWTPRSPPAGRRWPPPAPTIPAAACPVQPRRRPADPVCANRQPDRPGRGGRLSADRRWPPTPRDHPDRARHLLNLGAALRARFGRTGVPGPTWTRPSTPAAQAVAVEVASPLCPGGRGPRLGRAAAGGGQWQEAVAGFAAAVELVGQVAPRSLARSDQEHLLEELGGLGPDAAACCVHAGLAGRAVELFEQGRGVLLGQALDTRTDLTALASSIPSWPGGSPPCVTVSTRPTTTPAGSRWTWRPARTGTDGTDGASRPRRGGTPGAGTAAGGRRRRSTR